MSVDERVLAVIESLYEAAADESRWPDVLRQLADVTASQAVTFWVLDGSDQPRLPTFTYINLEPAFIQEYLDCMTPLDPTVQYLVRHPHQPIVHDGLIISERDKDRHPYYDWHGRHSELRFRMVGQACPAPAVQAGVALHRTRKAGRYEVCDLERFTLLQRHLQRALALGVRLGSLGTLQQCTTELLDRNPAAIVLLDSQKRIVFANRGAETLEDARDGVSLSGGVALANRDDNKKLQAVIDRTICHLGGADAGGAIQGRRPSGMRPYGIFVSPISRSPSALSTLKPAVCLIIVDPDATTAPPVGRLEAVLHLTPAEARLAALLATGLELKDAAVRLGITYGTARTRLAAIFQKTDTRRQGELIKLLLTTMTVA
jgi:DNA-binding CsgD family transcriptional regulator